MQDPSDSPIFRHNLATCRKRIKLFWSGTRRGRTKLQLGRVIWYDEMRACVHMPVLSNQMAFWTELIDCYFVCDENELVVRTVSASFVGVLSKINRLMYPWQAQRGRRSRLFVNVDRALAQQEFARACLPLAQRQRISSSSDASVGDGVICAHANSDGTDGRDPDIHWVPDPFLYMKECIVRMVMDVFEVRYGKEGKGRVMGAGLLVLLFRRLKAESFLGIEMALERGENTEVHHPQMHLKLFVTRTHTHTHTHTHTYTQSLSE